MLHHNYKYVHLILNNILFLAYQGYRACVDILLGTFCHLHVLFFHPCSNTLFQRDRLSVHTAFKLSPWLEFTKLTSFFHEKKTLPYYLLQL